MVLFRQVVESFSMDLKPDFKSLLSSTFLLTAICLVLIDCGLHFSNVLSKNNHASWLPLDSMVAKIPDYLQSDVRPQVLIMGSSLPMCAIAVTDYKTYGAPPMTSVKGMRCYLQDRYLTDKLKNLTGAAISVTNLSLVAAMCSDVDLLLEHSLSAKKKPAVVVLCLAPRDLIDNRVQAIGQSGAYQLLADGDPNLSQSAGSGHKFGLSSFSSFYQAKDQCKEAIVSRVCELLDHPADLLSGISPDKQWDCKDFADYRCRYDPPNRTRFKQESAYLQKIARLCRLENIQLVLVNMPLPRANKALIDKDLYAQYQLTLKSLVGRGVTYANLDSDWYSDQCFLDCAHLNTKGAFHFQDQLADLLVRSGSLDKSVASR